MGPDRSARTRGGRGRDQQNLARLDLIRVGQGVDALNNRRIEVIIASDLIADLVQRIAGLDGIGNKIERNAPSGGSTGYIGGGGQGGRADRRRGGGNSTRSGAGSGQLQLLPHAQPGQLRFAGEAVELHDCIFAVIIVQSVLFADLHQNLAGLDLVGDEVIR